MSTKTPTNFRLHTRWLQDTKKLKFHLRTKTKLVLQLTIRMTIHRLKKSSILLRSVNSFYRETFKNLNKTPTPTPTRMIKNLIMSILTAWISLKWAYRSVNKTKLLVKSGCQIKLKIVMSSIITRATYMITLRKFLLLIIVLSRIKGSKLTNLSRQQMSLLGILK